MNLAVGSPGVRYKQSNMPFVQMENISHFLHACQVPPLSLPSHDVFLTVDLYEAKDPAQVLQCIGAFSRRANALQPGKFPRAIGKSKSDVVSPQITGSSHGGGFGTPPYSRARGVSNVSASRPFSPSSSPKHAVSSWSSKTQEDTTAPAWNIHQYGYMGGANQGTLGISFGARRQITTPSPAIPSLADKEKKRQEESEKQRLQADEERRRQAEEEMAKAEEARRWEEETAQLREQERRQMEEEKRRWAEEQRQWEEEDQRRQREEQEAEGRLEKERQQKREAADARLNGQFLSQYQANQRPTRGTPPMKTSPAPSAESERIKALERELELAKERERQYEREHQEFAEDRRLERARPPPMPVKPSYDLSSQEKERQMLRSEWTDYNDSTSSTPEPPPPTLPTRSLPEPPPKPPRNPALSPARPLPDPSNYVNKSRTDRFLENNPAPVEEQPVSHRPPEFTSTAEIDEENRRRNASTQKTKAGGWASKSLLEREMERERERQREWEDNQQQTREAAKSGVNSAGTGPGEGGWDVNQYGYLGGDNQSRGSTGINFGTRRQIIGPRQPR